MTRKVGDRVTIYEDPFTQKKPEGEAKLLKHLPDVSYGMLEIWEVEFPDGSVVIRSIARKGVKAVDPKERQS